VGNLQELKDKPVSPYSFTLPIITKEDTPLKLEMYTVSQKMKLM
jgi:hypothetical protein